MTSKKNVKELFSGQTHPLIASKTWSDVATFFAHVPGVDNSAIDYLSHQEVRLEDKKYLDLHTSTPVSQGDVDIASKSTHQEGDETDDYPLDQAEEHIEKKCCDTPYEEPSSRTDQERPTPTENDVQQIRTNDNNGHGKTLVEGQLAFIRIVNTNSLSTSAMNSVGPSNTVKLQVVPDNKCDIQKFRPILLEQLTPASNVNLENQFFFKNSIEKTPGSDQGDIVEKVLWQHR